MQQFLAKLTRGLASAVGRQLHGKPSAYSHPDLGALPDEAKSISLRVSSAPGRTPLENALDSLERAVRSDSGSSRTAGDTHGSRWFEFDQNPIGLAAGACPRGDRARLCSGD